MKTIEVIFSDEQRVAVTARKDAILVFSGNGWTLPGKSNGYILCTLKPKAMRARNLESGMMRLIRMALLALEMGEVCERCGSEKPADRSCDCFDNHCQ
jgi:hypothetical protein